MCVARAADVALSVSLSLFLPGLSCVTTYYASVQPVYSQRACYRVRNCRCAVCGTNPMVMVTP